MIHFKRGNPMPKVSDAYIQNKKDQIIEATYQLALIKPIGSITMQEVIDASHLSQGGIYRFFKDIDEIICGVIQKIRTEIDLIPTFDEIFMKYHDQPVQVVEHIFVILKDYMMSHLTDFCKIDFEIKMLAMQNPKRMKKIFQQMEGEGSFEHLTAQILQYLQEQIEIGTLHPCIPVDQFCAYTASAFDGIQIECINASCYLPHQPLLKQSFQPDLLLETLKLSMLYLLGEKR